MKGLHTDKYLSQLLPKGRMHATCSSIQEASYTGFRVPAPSWTPEGYLRIRTSCSFLDNPKITFCHDLCYTTVQIYGLVIWEKVRQSFRLILFCVFSPEVCPSCTVSTNLTWAWGWHCGAICKHKPIICGFQAKTPMDNIKFSFATLGTVGTWHPKGEI